MSLDYEIIVPAVNWPSLETIEAELRSGTPSISLVRLAGTSPDDQDEDPAYHIHLDGEPIGAGFWARRLGQGRGNEAEIDQLTELFSVDGFDMSKLVADDYLCWVSSRGGEDERRALRRIVELLTADYGAYGFEIQKLTHGGPDWIGQLEDSGAL